MQYFGDMHALQNFLETNSVENLACELRIRRERAQIIRSRIIPSVVEQ